MALMLDALSPPAPRQLLADVQQEGAVACALYVWRRRPEGEKMGNGTWTHAHVPALRDAGLHVLPIVVPGNRPPDSDFQDAADAATAFGCPVGPIVLNLERPDSAPPRRWVQGCIDHLRSLGWKVIRYGDVPVLADYPTADGDWVSHGFIPVTRDRMRPVPELPSGVVGDQYSIEVGVNGSRYDASVVSPALFTGAGSAAARLASSEGTMIILHHPTITGRLDLLVVDVNGHCAHTFSEGGAGGLDNITSFSDLGPLPSGRIMAGTLAACWDDRLRLCVVAANAGGQAHLKVVRSSGVLDQDWTPINAAVSIPGH